MDKEKTAITDGHFWAKSVAKIEVVPGGVDDWMIKLNGIEKTYLTEPLSRAPSIVLALLIRCQVGNN